MADNVQLPITGTGTADTVVATDDVTSVHYPFVKLVDGTLGSTAKIGGDATNGLDVDVTRVQESLSSAQTTTWTTATAGDTALTLAVTGYATAILHYTTDGGTCSVGEMTFEESIDGGTTWAYATPHDHDMRGGLYGILDLTATSGTAVTWQPVLFDAVGRTHIRVRLSGAITGTIEVDLRLVGATSPLAAVLVQTILRSDSGVALVIDSAGKAATQAYGWDGSATRAIKTDAAGELQVDVLTLPALVAGTANIGDVDVLTLPADPLGANADAASATGSISAKLRSIAAVQLPAALAAGGGLKVEGVAGGVAVPISVATIPSHAVTLASTTITGDVTVIGKAADGAAVSGNPVLMAGQDGTNVQSLKTDTSGELQVDVLTLPNVTIGTMAALVAGTAEIGKLAAGTANIGDVDVLTVPADPFGANADAASITGSISAKLKALLVEASTINSTSSDGGTALAATAQAIKASAGTLLGYYIYNPNATAQFVQFYNTASGSVTVGTTNPLFMLTIPAVSAANLWMQPSGVAFGTAMSWSATSTAGGNGAPGSSLDAVCWYK